MLKIYREKKMWKRKTNAVTSNIVLLHAFIFLGNGRWTNVNIVMTLKDLNYCLSASLTITEFVLLSMVILEDSCMLDTYFSEILNKIKK